MARQEFQGGKWLDFLTTSLTMVPRKFLLLVFCLLYAASGFGQFNDTTNYYVNLNSTGIVNKTTDGNSYVLNNGLRFSVYKKHISVNSTSRFIYGEQQDNLTNQDFSSAMDFDFLKKLRRIYYWGLGSYEKSYSLKINHRMQTGVGIGYTLVNRKNAVLVISDGILYEKSELLAETEGQITGYETFRNSFRIKLRCIIRDRIVIESTDFHQQSLSDKHDYILRSQTQLSVKLIQWLSFTTSVTYNKLGRMNNENLLINFGLTIEKYF
jgi:hypothetical protein